MSKSSGLGDNLYVGGYDLSGDIGSLGKISGGPAVLDVTGINQDAFERIGGRRDGAIDYTAFYNPAAGQAHPVLSALPTTDAHVMYCRGTTLGNPAACMVGKQANYDPTLAADGALTFGVQALANRYGLEWGVQMTPGKVTLTSAVTGDNSTFEGGIGTWVSNQNSTVAATAAQAHAGTGALEITSAAAGNTSAKHVSAATGGIAVTAGTNYFVQAWVRSAVSARTMWAGVNWYTAGGALISTGQGSNVTSSTSAWTLSSGTLTAPATAAYATLIVQANSAGGAAEGHYVDDVTFFPLHASRDYAADAGGNFDAQAYLQVFAFTGADVTVKVQSSADNAAADPFSDRISFTSVTSAPASERKAMTSPGSQIMERYCRYALTTTAGFSSLTMALVLARNEMAVAF